MTEQWPEPRNEPSDTGDAMHDDMRSGAEMPAESPSSDRPVSSTAAIATAGSTDAGTATSPRFTESDARTSAGTSPSDGRDDDPTTSQPQRAPSTTIARETPLFDASQATDLRNRWTDIQAGFVDEPRSAVEHADALVAEVMKRLAEGFASERSALEERWSKGGDASTEDLRVALRRYRSFFDRLLSIQ